MPHSSIRRLFNAATNLAAQGVDVIRLDIGDPDFDLPDRIGDAVKRAIDSHKTHYSPMQGLPELRQAISKHLLARYAPGGGEFIDWEYIVANQGATQALNSCFQFVCSRNESALLPEIYFPNYMQQLCLAGIQPGFYLLDGNFQPVDGQLEGVCQEGTMAILVNSPSNPTGAVFSEATVRRIYEFARLNNLWIISDEAYCDFVYDGAHLSPLQVDWEYPEHERRVLAVFSFSKSYAATGLRMGWTVCPTKDIARAFSLQNEPLTGSLTTPLQIGLARAFDENDTIIRLDVLRERRDLAVGILREAGFDVPVPGGGIFSFLDISRTGYCSDEFCDRLLAEEHVAVVPGSGFGLQPEGDVSGSKFTPGELSNRCVRLCFAAPIPRLELGVKRLADFINRHFG